MYSVLLIALWGIAPSVRQEPNWITDYSEARKLSQTEGKPIAVLIGSGSTGYNEVSREGRLGKDNDRLLAKSYVCFYVDTASEEGRRLSRALEMDEPRGIVISNSKGTLQAFRHQGNLSNAELTQYLERFSNPNLVVSHTESNPPEPSYSAPISTSRSC
jgi:hypothetical protein